MAHSLRSKQNLSNDITKKNKMKIYEILAAPSPQLQQMVMPILLVVIFWVVLIRPQQKRAKALRQQQAGLKKGDNVVTIGGMHATVNSVSDKTVSLRISEGIYMKYDRTAVASVLTKEVDKD